MSNYNERAEAIREVRDLLITLMREFKKDFGAEIASIAPEMVSIQELGAERNLKILAGVKIEVATRCDDCVHHSKMDKDTARNRYWCPTINDWLWPNEEGLVVVTDVGCVFFELKEEE